MFGIAPKSFELILKTISGFKEIENENKEENCFCGEIWSVSEMEMTKDDYFNKR